MKNISSRSSNFELLRIVSMLAIVAGHFLQACSSGNVQGTDLLSSYALGSGLCIAVNLFVMTGAWFMIEYDFKACRVLRLYCQTLFYSWLFFALELVFLPDLSLGEKLRNIEPFFGFPYWFVTVYLMLLLVAPYLKRAFVLPRSTLTWLLVVLGVFLCGFSTYPSGNSNVITNFLWFVFLFLFVGSVKSGLVRCSRCKMHSIGRMGLLVGLFVYAVLVACRWCGVGATSGLCRQLGNLSVTYIYNIQSIPNFLCSLGVFLWFASLDLGSRPLINLLAKNAFGVYLIHCPFFNHFFWLVAGAAVWGGGWSFPVFLVLAAILTYLLCACIDSFRAKFLEPWLLSSRWFEALCQKIDGVYAKV